MPTRVFWRTLYTSEFQELFANVTKIIQAKIINGTKSYPGILKSAKVSPTFPLDVVGRERMEGDPLGRSQSHHLPPSPISPFFWNSRHFLIGIRKPGLVPSSLSTVLPAAPPSPRLRFHQSRCPHPSLFTGPAASRVGPRT